MKYRSRVSGYCWAVELLIIVFILSMASASNAAVYQCRIMDTAYWNGSQIGKAPKHRELLKSVIEFDNITGLLVRDGLKDVAKKYVIIQSASDVSDLVAVSVLETSESAYDWERASQFTLRIRGWDEDQGLNFLWIQKWEMLSGKCVIRPH